MSEKTQSPYLVPFAIIVAGVFIAAAVYYAPEGGNGSNSRDSKTIAEAVGLSPEKIRECVDSGEMKDNVIKETSDGISFIQSLAQKNLARGVGTPFSVIVGSNNRVLSVIPGALSFVQMEPLIERALKGEGDVTETILFSPREDDHIRGEKDAPVKIVEFSDLECPFCKRFHVDMQQVMEKYGNDGKVAWIYRHLPLTQLHPKAQKEAEATECAAKLGGDEAFWAYTDKLFEITPANNGLDFALLPASV